MNMIFSLLRLYPFLFSNDGVSLSPYEFSMILVCPFPSILDEIALVGSLDWLLRSSKTDLDLLDC